MTPPPPRVPGLGSQNNNKGLVIPFRDSLASRGLLHVHYMAVVSSDVPLHFRIEKRGVPHTEGPQNSPGPGNYLQQPAAHRVISINITTCSSCYRLNCVIDGALAAVVAAAHRLSSNPWNRRGPEIFRE